MDKRAFQRGDIVALGRGPERYLVLSANRMLVKLILIPEYPKRFDASKLEFVHPRRVMHLSLLPMLELDWPRDLKAMEA